MQTYIISFLMALFIFMRPYGVSEAASKKVSSDRILSSWQVTTNDHAILEKITDRYEIVKKRGSTYEVYVPRSEVAAFQLLAPTAQLALSDIREELQFLIRKNPNYLKGYRSFSEMERFLYDLERKFPDIIRLSIFGRSEQGNPLYAVKVSGNVSQDEVEPHLMLTAATHGDELITTEVVLNLIEELALGFHQDSRLSDIVNHHAIYFVPVVNPDGFLQRDRYANGVDPNRDYPWPESPDRKSVACVQKLIEFFHSKPFEGSIDFHAFGQMIMYPWAYTKESPDPDQALGFDALAKYMGELNHYRFGQISKIIYVAKGSSADYYHWQAQSLSYGIELTESKVPPAHEIPEIVDQAREMTLRFIEHF